jgi:hypothetical protein
MVSWWDGDAVAGTTAGDIKDGNPGTMKNGVTIVPGKVGNAFNFDGVDDYITIPQSLNLEATKSALTWDAWIKTGSTAQFQAIMEWGNWSDVGAHFYVANGNILFANLVTADGTSHMVASGAVLTFGAFNHVALTYDGNVARLYANGVEVANTLVSGNLKTSTELLIGERLQFGGQLRFNGVIDEVEVFNRALAAQEIKAIFDAGNKGKCKP